MAQVRDISFWFHREIWLPRVAVVVGFQSLATLIMTFVTLALLQLDMFHPFSSIYGILTAPFSWRYWLVSFAAAIMSIPGSVAGAQLTSARDQAFSDRLSRDGWCFVGYVTLWSILKIVAEFVVALCCMKLNMTQADSLGVVGYGVVIVSLLAVASSLFHRRYRLHFPLDSTYRQYKKLTLFLYERGHRSQASSTALFLVYGLGIFLTTFILFGWRINRALFGHPTTFLDAIWRVIICRPGITWAVGVLSTATIYRQNFMVALFDLVLCKPIQFVLPSSDLPALGQESELFFTLGEAMAAKNSLLLKYLAFLDLRLLTLQRQPRMQHIFTVSKPGGHARSWSSILGPSLFTLQSQIKAIHDTNEKLAAAWECRIEQAVAGRGLAGAQGRGPSMIQPKHWNRDWKLHGDSSLQPQNGDHNRQQLRPYPIAIMNFNLPACLTAIWQVYDPTARREIWTDLQIQLWNIEALGHIVSSSYTDDKYGIIQRDLATIVGTMLDLHFEADRYSRLVTSQRIDRHHKAEIDANLVKLRDQLALSMMEIYNSFGNLNDITLTDQQRTLLKRVLDNSGLRK